MGWLELLPLLKRLLPLLDRVAPMLEGMVAGRMGGRAAADANASSAAELARHSSAVQVTLEGQNAALGRLVDEVGVLVRGTVELQARTAALDAKVALLGRAVRTAAVVLGGLLLVCVVLLVILLLRHR